LITHKRQATIQSLILATALFCQRHWHHDIPIAGKASTKLATEGWLLANTLPAVRYYSDSPTRSICYHFFPDCRPAGMFADMLVPFGSLANYKLKLNSATTGK